MGMLVEGKWVLQKALAKASSDGKITVTGSQVRNWVTKNGSPGATGVGGFAAEPGRYHLYASKACPFAHRSLIFRSLKDLHDVIGVSFVSPLKFDDGWTFNTSEGSTGDSLNNFQFLREVYSKSDPNYTGRVTVAVLWDKKTGQIVSNESSDIIRMFNSEFNDLTGNTLDFYPSDLQSKIDAINEFISSNVNNGVYACGFATAQEAYEGAFAKLFSALDTLEEILGKNRYLVGPRITEADWRLFTTLLRFDAVYAGHFKCNKRSLESYPNLSNYLRELYQWPGVAETVDLELTKNHYYRSHIHINPTGIVPKGPELDFTRPHNRASI